MAHRSEDFLSHEVPPQEFAAPPKRKEGNFPSRHLPPTENGAGRMLFNRGNPEDVAFNPEDPLSKVLHTLILYRGDAPLEQVSDVTAMPEEEVRSVADIKNVIEVFPGEDGKDHMIAPPLQEFLREMTEKKVKHPLLPLSGDVSLSAD